MATTTVSSITRSERGRAAWYWKSNADPWGNADEEWTKYSDIENEIIEDAYQQGQSKTKIDHYIVNLKKLVQIHDSDAHKQRSIKRVTGIPTEVHLRKERFFLPPTSSNRSLSGPSKAYAFWAQNDFVYHPYCKIDTSLWVGKAADGILIEGDKLEKHCEAEWLANELLKVKGVSDKTVGECCVNLYTKESFLYKVTNEVLREEVNRKQYYETLGPFWGLLFRFVRTLPPYKETRYRGATLTEGHIDQYRKAIKQGGSFGQFTSSSKSRVKAESFGNVLFIIDDSPYSGGFGGHSSDISFLSDYPDEEEVLITPGSCIAVKKIEQDAGKYIINLWIGD